MSKHILLVDDDPWMGDMYGHKLRLVGYKVTIAYSAQEALDCFDRHQLDLVVLDLIMPTNNGLSLLYERPTYRDIRETPLFILSSVRRSELGVSDDLWAALAVDRYIYKPESKPAELVDVIEEYFS